MPALPERNEGQHQLKSCKILNGAYVKASGQSEPLPNKKILWKKNISKMFLLRFFEPVEGCLCGGEDMSG